MLVMGRARMAVHHGRYQDNRPRGLAVTEDGVIELENLMQSWGRRQCFQERDIMRAISKYMFHIDDGDGFRCLRFAIDSDPQRPDDDSRAPEARPRKSREPLARGRDRGKHRYMTMRQRDMRKRSLPIPRRSQAPWPTSSHTIQRS